MLNKELPADDSAETKSAVRRLCMKDALVGSLTILLIIMVIDQAGRDISPWWWYLILWAILYLIECAVNWRRYISQFREEKTKNE